ncbi:MAG TPA: Nif3-like dinuclear metal center hexameric protein [Clostridiales bacterium]|nr:Nif3-like dinuclear metal center hexameric protein [Clostridiales bacterium]
MPTVKTIRDYFESRVPTYLKMDFDNVGLLVGMADKPVTKALVSLDITGEVISEAVEWGAELIVSHHPLFFELKRISDEDLIGRKVIGLISAGISAICLHTNLDTVEGGVNDALMSLLGGRVTGLLNQSGLTPEGKPYGISRIGELDSPVEFDSFLIRIKSALNAAGVRYYSAGHPVLKLAVCGGSGGGDLPLAASSGCDTFVTADVKYDQFLAAKDYGINLIDAGHFCTENVVTPVIAAMLKDGFPEIEVRISSKHKQIDSYY